MVPVIERIAAELDVLVSVDTYKPEVAEAAIAAGAGIVNDVSGLRDPALADVCARTGAALVLMHTRVAPKGTLLDPGAYDDVVADVAASCRADGGRALARGGRASRSCSTPGPTSPRRRRRRSRCCARLGALRALGRPVLLAVSRKDFLGAITGRGPRRAGRRDAGRGRGRASTPGRSILRVHDVAAAADFLAVRAVLRGERELAPDEGLTPDRFPDALAS